MSSATIPQQVRNFLAENYLLGQEFSLEDGDSFLENGIIDSTGVLQLVAFLEHTYGITVEDGDLIPDNLDSIEKISVYLRRKQGGSQSEAPVPPSHEAAPGEKV